jgi:DNA replication initiation complex subunit (GINS family)
VTPEEQEFFVLVDRLRDERLRLEAVIEDLRKELRRCENAVDKRPAGIPWWVPQ